MYILLFLFLFFSSWACLTREPEETPEQILGTSSHLNVILPISPKSYFRNYKILTNGTEVNLYNGQSMRYSIENVSFDNAGNYTCVLTNPYERLRRTFD